MALTVEKHARELVGVLAEFFPAGAACEDLRFKFQKIANRKHATFYWCLRFAKDRGWIVSDEGTYKLAADGSWRTPPAREEARAWDPDQFEHVLAARTAQIEKLEAARRRLISSRKAIAAGEAAGPAISALVEIMADANISIRKRIQASEVLLGFKTPPDVAEAAKRFLAAVFMNPEENIDHRLAATMALRRSEDVRIVPAIERPPAARSDDPEPPEPLSSVLERRRAHCNALTDKIAREMGLRPGEPADTSDPHDPGPDPAQTAG